MQPSKKSMEITLRAEKGLIIHEAQSLSAVCLESELSGNLAYALEQEGITGLHCAGGWSDVI